MSIEEFIALNDIEKEEVVLDGGVYLMSDNIENRMVDMYRLGDFFIQFRYEMNSNEGATIEAFRKQEDMVLFNKRGTLAI